MSLFRAISARLYAVVIFCQLTMMQCRERMIQGLCALVTFLLPGMAFADGDLADMFGSAASGAKSGKTSGLEIAGRSVCSSSSVPCCPSKSGHQSADHCGPLLCRSGHRRTTGRSP